MAKDILAIDPGTDKSAFVRWNGNQIIRADIWHNEFLLEDAREYPISDLLVAIEMVASYGMAVGKEVFGTCVLIGRLVEAFEPRGIEVRLIFRKDVKLHHCGSMRAKDSNIRQALIDKYGAPGTKKAPGLTHGIKSHLWAAFAIATYITETQGNGHATLTGDEKHNTNTLGGSRVEPQSCQIDGSTSHGALARGKST